MVSDLIAVFSQINYSIIFSQRNNTYFNDANYYSFVYAHSHKNKEDRIHNKTFESTVLGPYDNVCASMPYVWSFSSCYNEQLF